MSIPYKEVTVTSAVGAYLLVARQPNLLLFSNPSYIGTFAQLWLLQFSTWAFYQVILWPKYLSPLRHLPSPSGDSWWNGQFGRIRKDPSGDPMKEWVNTIPNDGIIRYLGLFNSERLLLTSPEALSEVLTTKSYEFVKPAQSITFLARLLGYGILVQEGDEHKRQRKNLKPAFAFRHVKDLYPLFWQKSREGVIAIAEHIRAGGLSQEEMGAITRNTDLAEGEAVIEVGDWGSRVTLDIIGEAGMGKNFGAIQDPNTALNITYRKVFKPNAGAALLGLLSLFLPGWVVRNLPVKRNEDIAQAVAVIRAECRELVRIKKEKLEKHQLPDVDILSVAMESGGFSDENLVDQMMTFLAAGHETTATAMTWAVYMLCLNPEIQTRLRKEIRAKLPSINHGDAQITSQDIDSLPYLNAFCSEVLRYYAPVPMTLRDAAIDSSILGQRVPKGTRIVICPWSTNKQESLWGPSYAKFDPTRWLQSDEDAKTANANGGAKSNYAYLTFLHGPKSCIGQGFAKGEFACLIAAWVGTFEFRLNDEKEWDEEAIEIKGGITAKPHRGMHVRTRVVEGW